MELPLERASCDVLVVGGGTAALVAALEARKSVERVVVACKRKPGRSGNTVVSGAAFGAFVAYEGTPDSVEQHLRDTLESGDGINDPSLARTLASRAGEIVLGLEQYGVRFLRTDGQLMRRRPPGHSRARSLPTDPARFAHTTRGLAISLPLLTTAQEWGITLLSGAPVHRLLVREGVIRGAMALDLLSGRQVAVSARSVVLASGGGGHLFANTNNTSDMTGDSCALALEAGAPLRDMEFVQFFPTTMSSPAHATISSPLFAEGAVLRNRHGDRFMPRYDPVNAEMATRDVTSRAIFDEIQAGNGVQGGVYMDLSGVPSTSLEKRFATIANLLRVHGIDPATRWLVVGPTTHFLMGGAWIDARCQTRLQGLFVAGEAAGGTHGANRLAGNALTEAAVFGAIAGREAGAHAAALNAAPDIGRPKMGLPPRRSDGLALAEVKAQLRRAMWEQASIVRTESGLLRAEAALRECLGALPSCRVSDVRDVGLYLEIERMAWAGLAIVTAALARRESRGAHFRSDCPDRDDARWLGSTRVTRAGERLAVDFVPLEGAPRRRAPRD